MNPRLVYVSISGFGQTGPYADRAGLDQIAQGLSGFMTVNGFPGQGPLRAGLPIADLTGGPDGGPRRAWSRSSSASARAAASGCTPRCSRR